MNGLRIPPLRSGGVMLSYHCSNACRHCLYRCSPKHDAVFMAGELLEATFAALAAERALSGVHLAGGEATCGWEALDAALAWARRHRVRIDYLETNGSWCTSPRTARDGFSRLRSAGLRAVLISASLFHNEFIPLRHTLNAIAAAEAVFGHGGVIVWTPDVLSRMQRHLDPDRTHTLSESRERLGLSGPEVWKLHSYLTPGGRAAEALGEGLLHEPPEAFRGQGCAAALASTSHFHIDPAGHLFTGLCPGISPGGVADLHPEITPERFPVYAALCDGGPVALLERLAGAFEPSPQGYLSKCHLCLAVRKHLRMTGEYPELGAAGFYLLP